MWLFSTFLKCGCILPPCGSTVELQDDCCRIAQTCLVQLCSIEVTISCITPFCEICDELKCNKCCTCVSSTANTSNTKDSVPALNRGLSESRGQIMFLCRSCLRTMTCEYLCSINSCSCKSCNTSKLLFNTGWVRCCGSSTS